MRKMISGLGFAFLVALSPWAWAISAESYPGVLQGYPAQTDVDPFEYCGLFNPYFSNPAAGGGQCTAFAWGRAKEKLNLTLASGIGNAGRQWWDYYTYYYSSGDKYNPRANALALWSKGDSTTEGHAAFVEEVIGDNVIINEANWSPTNLDWGAGYNGIRTLSKTAMQLRGSYKLIGYIYLPSPPSPTVLSVNGAAVAGNISVEKDVDLYQFTVGSTAQYSIDTWAGTLIDDYIYLYGPNSKTNLIAKDDNAGDGNMALISKTLAPGTYYVKVRAASVSGTASKGTYTIGVTSGPYVAHPTAAGESWVQNGSYTITWRGFTGTNVRIDLYKGTSLNRTIQASAANNGAFAWQVPASQTPGSDYKIKITSTSNSSQYDSSNNAFTIAAAAPVVSTLKINNGAASASSRTVTLNNTCTGTPTYYMASENSSFSGASWLAYSTAPSFSLTSSGFGSKTVWFKVKNASGLISSPKSAAIQLVDLQQLKVSVQAQDGTLEPGERIHYAITIGNAGALSLTNVKLEFLVPNYCSFFSDDAAPNAEGYGTYFPGNKPYWNLGTLEPGESRIVHLSMFVSSSAPYGSTIPFSASVSSAQGYNAISNSVNTVIQSSPVLSLGMVTDQNPVSSGEKLTYTVTYANRSNMNSPGATLRIPVPAGTTLVACSSGGSYGSGAVTWNMGTLAPSQSGQHQFTVTVNSAVNGSLIRAEAELFDAALPQNKARASAATAVRATAPLQLAVAATGDRIQPGERITYAMTVSNRGTQTMTNVQLGALTPAYCNFSSSDASPDAESYGAYNPGNQAYWLLGSLEPGESRVVQLSVNVDTQAPSGIVLHLGAVARSGATTNAGATGSMAFASRDVATDLTPVLSMGLSADKNPIGPGEKLTYTVTYANRGNLNSPGAILRVPIPAGTTLSSSGGAISSSGALTWYLGNLAPGQSGQQQFSVTVNTAANGNLIRAEAVLTDGASPKNSARASAVTAVRAGAPLQLAVAATGDRVQPGEHVAYTMTLSNRGSQTMTDVSLALLTPDYCNSSSGYASPEVEGYGAYNSGTQAWWNLGALEPGESRTVLLSVHVDTLTPSGMILHLGAAVRAGATTNAGAMGSMAFATRDVAVDLTPVLSLGLAADKSPAGSGELLTYTVTYANRSNLASPGATLRAAVPAGTTLYSSGGASFSGGVLTWTLGTLAPGQSGQKQFSVTVNAAGNGNLIRAEADMFDGASPKNTARAGAVTAIRAAAPLQLDVSVLESQVLPDERVSIMMTVTNLGTQALSNVKVGMITPNYCSFSSEDSIPNAANYGSYITGFSAYWNLGTVLPGTSKSISLMVHVNRAAPEGVGLNFDVNARNATSTNAGATGSMAFESKNVVVTTP